ncbi:DNA translocase FtsK [Lactobacillus sp. LC28-10]|uniref:DNA translocase FtsK n=1 Tax=Secundilactobacillus angelensis TaxID=2722706 RepID=A0ABX1L3T5_9LACO|nr:DNA translocase FtsK [Secundilactobacillus angelensis]MCH5463143.1 DNA translocase FtsK [Secundilactobacillus angelensis]NLR18996.1 DNA translocase FtsK [Secundilactobacillus angelensis]
MAQKRKTTRRRKAKTTNRRKKGRQSSASYTANAIGLILLTLCLLAFFKAGFVGSLMANLIRFVVGDTYPLMSLFGVAVGLALLITGQLPKISAKWFWSIGTMYLGVLLWLHVDLFLSENQHTGFLSYTWQLLSGDLLNNSVSTAVGGGTIGAVLLAITQFLVAFGGAKVIAVLLVLIGVMIAFNVSGTQILKWTQICAHWLGRIASRISHTLVTVAAKFKQNRSQSAKRVVKPKPVKVAPAEEKDLPTPVAERHSTPEQPEDSSSPAIPISVATRENAPERVTKKTPEKQEEDSESTMISTVGDDPNYQLPGNDLLTPIPQKDQQDDYKTIEKNTKILKKTLDSFGVDAEIKHVNLGPSVTEYELHPAIGVKVSRIVNLADDLALALAAKEIRIEAPIPGKSLIGIEVPNKEISTVSFRDVSEAVTHGPAHLLEVPLGRDVTGKVITMDLTKMPHLLIAGSTGSGKSVAINGIITSILMNAKPSQVKLMLIDPKKVELSVYNGIPHLLTPVVSEPKKAAKALHKVVHEMEQRYDLFAKVGQRKISGYNQFVQTQNQTTDKPLPTLPYIVVIVDELADLMMTVSNEVEDAIIRLAQMGRAAGIHMILATQRPSVDVITGLIKANVPSRMAFAVSSGVDSRTILDSNGAEKLLGRGDMLYMPVDQNSPIRIQGAFIPDKDVQRVTDFIRDQQTAEYDESMIVSDEEIAEDATQSDDDLFNEALEFVVEQQKASTSLLQRHFRIGYNRAARLIDDLEQGGFIGPQDGSKPRQVYKQPDSDA